MPTLLLEDVPQDLYEHLQHRAMTKQRTLSEETVDILREAVDPRRAKQPRQSDYIPGEEVFPPCDLPRSSTPVPIEVVPAMTPRLPDPPLLFGEGAPE